ncbi:2-hydroxyacid dehydrogenase [Specibacter cremeus]|uniref:2-hydroxyacid dehydrogenase n=1 Tax=Specibacter cremeus TaxID=1629051 RepID=UPI000F769DA8
MDILAAAGRCTVPEGALGPGELAAHCASGEFDVVVAQLGDDLGAATLGGARIRGIANYAVGYNNVDVAAATARGIMVANTPDVLTDATADLTLLLMLGTARRVVEADAFMRAGHYTGWHPRLLLGADVSGRTLGLAGFGRIARAVARRALGFGMEVIFAPRPPAHRTVGRAELGELAGRVRQVDWPTLVAQSDFLSLHVPLTEQTHHLVNAPVLAAMKDTAILVNTARGPVVDEAALVEALRTGSIAGAGLDVYEHEPALADGLAALPNTLLLPHLGSATVAVRAAMAKLCAENAVALAAGRIPAHPVNPEAWG